MNTKDEKLAEFIKDNIIKDAVHTNNRTKLNSKQYRVAWFIDVWAENAEEAAKQALEIQRDAASIATVFHVVGVNQTAYQIVDMLKEASDAVKSNEVVIEVFGGIAECTVKPSDVIVTIVDHNNEDDSPY